MQLHLCSRRSLARGRPAERAVLTESSRDRRSWRALPWPQDKLLVTADASAVEPAGWLWQTEAEGSVNQAIAAKSVAVLRPWRVSRRHAYTRIESVTIRP